MGGDFLPSECGYKSAGFTDKSVAEVLVGKHLTDRKLHYSTLEAYEETPVFIHINMTEDVVELVVRKRLGTPGTFGMVSEDSQW